MPTFERLKQMASTAIPLTVTWPRHPPVRSHNSVNSEFIPADPL